MLAAWGSWGAHRGFRYPFTACVHRSGAAEGLIPIASGAAFGSPMSDHADALVCEPGWRYPGSDLRAVPCRTREEALLIMVEHADADLCTLNPNQQTLYLKKATASWHASRRADAIFFSAHRRGRGDSAYQAHVEALGSRGVYSDVVGEPGWRYPGQDLRSVPCRSPEEAVRLLAEHFEADLCTFNPHQQALYLKRATAQWHASRRADASFFSAHRRGRGDSAYQAHVGVLGGASAVAEPLRPAAQLLDGSHVAVGVAVGVAPGAEANTTTAVGGGSPCWCTPGLS